jgi:hypothetical protein
VKIPGRLGDSDGVRHLCCSVISSTKEPSKALLPPGEVGVEGRDGPEAKGDQEAII